jgi:hypothetical protein
MFCIKKRRIAKEPKYFSKFLFQTDVEPATSIKEKNPKEMVFGLVLQ